MLTPDMEQVFILIDCLGRGGAEKIAVTLANELAAQGRDVHVLILRRNIAYELRPDVKLHIMTDVQFAKGYGHAVLEVLHGLRWVRDILRQFRRDRRSVMVSHLTRCNVINIAMELLLPHHRAVCVSHNSIGFYRGKGLAKRALLALQATLFPLAYRTVCVSKRMAADYRQLWLFRKHSVVTIYNPVTLPSDPSVAGADARHFADAVHIAMVGRLHPVKRHDVALRAMAILKERSRRTYVLHLLGDGPKESEIVSLVRELGLDDSVVLHGWVADTRPVVQQCAMSLLCSDTEGFPNSIVESLALGIPVVATDCVSGPRELLAPDEDVKRSLPFRDGIFFGRHGTLVRLGDPEALARAIEHQADVTDAARVQACVDFARQFDAAIVARQYGELVCVPPSP